MPRSTSCLSAKGYCANSITYSITPQLHTSAHFALYGPEPHRISGAATNQPTSSAIDISFKLLVSGAGEWTTVEQQIAQDQT